MTKLKTLKDISKNFNGWCRDEELKAEAVKWVKHFRDDKDCSACERADTFVTGWEDEPVLEDVTSIIAVLKHFFNLTEDDLK